jgi:Ser-tRNA(Ala) deacylase AlaX
MSAKSYDPVMHSTEHILSRVMINTYGCGPPVTTHLEKKKSKTDYAVGHDLTTEELRAIEAAVNGAIRQDLEVKIYMTPPAEAHPMVSTAKLPPKALESGTIRVVQIGDFDYSACIGAHVKKTSDIKGSFSITSSTWEGGQVRLRWTVR